MMLAGWSAIAAAILHVMTFEATLTVITVGNGLIGVWLLMTAALALSAALLPAGLGWLGIAGGAGMAVAFQWSAGSIR